MAGIKDSFINDGAVSPRTRGENVYNDSGGTLAVGDLVYFSGLLQPSGTNDKPCRKVKKADADSTTDLANCAQAIVRNAIVAGAQGRVFKTHRLSDQNTNAATVDDPVYLSSTAGGWTLTAPSTGSIRKQVVGRVAVKSATIGVIEFNLDEAPGGSSVAVDGTSVATLLPSSVIPGVPVIFEIPIADASADTDVVSTYKIKVIDFWFRNTGIAAHATLDTIQLKNGATAISDVIAKTATVEAVKRASTLAAASVGIAAGGTIRITAAKNTNAAVTAYVEAIRVA